MKYLLSILFGLAFITGYAQTNPNMTGTNILGSGVPSGNPAESPYAPNEPISFTIDAGNAGTSAMRYPPPGKFEVNINITNMGTPVIVLESGTNYFAPPVITDLGGGVWTIKLVQNAAIPAGGNGTFRISGVASRELQSGDGKYYVSYQANGKPGSYANSGADSNSDIGVIDEALPVTLTSFNVQKEGQTAQLNWATTQETNSAYFEIQHSIGGKEWTKVGKVASHGESTTLKNYTFSHSNPVNGENLYRLKMVDKDQTFAYSRMQGMTFTGLTESDLSVYPNPTVDVLRVRDFIQVTKVSIHDMNGRTVLESGISTTGEINVRNLTSGMYLVRVSRSNGLTSSQKIVVGK